MSDPENADAERVERPAEMAEDTDFHEYGRQLALDSVLRGMHLAEGARKIVPVDGRTWNRRAWLSASAASIATMAGFALWKFGQGKGGDVLAKLDPRWILEAAEGAEFLILGPQHVKLMKGELRLRSTEPAELVVETLNAKAKANGTDFLIGLYESTNKEKDMNKTIITRLLVLTGGVSLATGQGAADAEGNEALVAKGDAAPHKVSVKANSQFAFDLYSRLSKDDANANLFFSPYSVSNALLMMAEGARGKTALEMGRVLGFPEALARHGDDAQNIPWNVGRMTTGLAQLNQRMTGEGSKSLEQDKLREEDATLSKRLDAVRAEIELARKAKDMPRVEKAMAEQIALVAQVNKVRDAINTLTLKITNAVWSERTNDILAPWRETVTGSFGVDAVQEADFRNDAAGERLRINAWVEDETEGMIQDFFPDGSITNDVKLVVANAVYFQGEWVTPFPEEMTAEGEFSLKSGEVTEAALMKKRYDNTARYAAFNGDGSYFKTPETVPSGTEELKTYSDQDGFSMVEMPYHSGTISMVVIAPNDPKKFSELEQKLSSENVEKWIAALNQRRVHIELPKFEMKSSYKLKKVFKAMGMSTAFDPQRANFLGVSGREELFINEALHKAAIEVSEKGTVAAAVTGFVAPPKSSPTKEEPFFPEFSADRPFIYLIRDQESDTILFLGRVINPAE